MNECLFAKTGSGHTHYFQIYLGKIATEMVNKLNACQDRLGTHTLSF
eukprot:COSAG06_NODE_17128_length_959_cov_4.720930_3_plen_46_part_01